MTDTPQAGFSRIAALLADPAREAMLAALLDGRALPAGELAVLAGVTPQSASGHLARLVEGGILSVWKQGRFRYFRLASEQVAHALEALSIVARPGAHIRRIHGTPIAQARCCYNHLAGSLGVALTDALARKDLLRIEDDRAQLTSAGRRWAEAQGLIEPGQALDERWLRPCLDWTERRFHLAGTLPTALLTRLVEAGHLRRVPGQRTLALSPSGHAWFAALGVELPSIDQGAEPSRVVFLRRA